MLSYTNQNDYDQKQVIAHAGKDVGQGGHSSISDGREKLHNHFWSAFVGFW